MCACRVLACSLLAASPVVEGSEARSADEGQREEEEGEDDDEMMPRLLHTPAEMLRPLPTADDFTHSTHTQADETDKMTTAAVDVMGHCKQVPRRRESRRRTTRRSTRSA